MKYAARVAIRIGNSDVVRDHVARVGDWQPGQLHRSGQLFSAVQVLPPLVEVVKPTSSWHELPQAETG